MFAILRARLRFTGIHVSAGAPRVIRDIADKEVNTNPAELTCTYRCPCYTYARVYCMPDTVRFNGETIANTIVTNVFGKIRTCPRFFFFYSSLNTTCQTCSNGSSRLVSRSSCLCSTACLFLILTCPQHSFSLIWYKEIPRFIQEAGGSPTNRGMRITLSNTVPLEKYHEDLLWHLDIPLSARSKLIKCEDYIKGLHKM